MMRWMCRLDCFSHFLLFFHFKGIIDTHSRGTKSIPRKNIGKRTGNHARAQKYARTPSRSVSNAVTKVSARPLKSLSFHMLRKYVEFINPIRVSGRKEEMVKSKDILFISSQFSREEEVFVSAFVGIFESLVASIASTVE